MPNSSKTTAVASGYPGKPITGANTGPVVGAARRPGLPGGGGRLADLGSLGVAEQRGMAGADGDAGHRDAADLGEYRGGVVAAPPARPGDDKHQVGLGRRAPKLGGQRVRVVGHHGTDHGNRAELAAPCGEHKRVRVDDVASPQRGADRADLVPCRDDRDNGPPTHGHRGVPAGRRGSQVAGPQQPSRGDQRLPGAEVLARRPHVPPPRRVPRPPALARSRAAGVTITLPSSCGSSHSRITTVSVLAGIGSPVSIHSNSPAGTRTAWPWPRRPR